MKNPNKVSVEHRHSYDYKIMDDVLSVQREEISSVNGYMAIRRNLYEHSIENDIEHTTKEFISEAMDILRQKYNDYHKIALLQASANLSVHNKTIDCMESLAKKAGVDYSENIKMIKAKAEIARIKGMYQEVRDIL